MPSSVPPPAVAARGGGIPKWPPWARGVRRGSGLSEEHPEDGTCIPLADLRSTTFAAASANGSPLVAAHPKAKSSEHQPALIASEASSSPPVSFQGISSTHRQLQTIDHRQKLRPPSPPPSSSSSSSSCSPPSSPPLNGQPPSPQHKRADNGVMPLDSDTGDPVRQAAAVVDPGDYMRGIAAEARAWGARAFAGGVARDDPVTLLLPEAAMGQRVGGPAGRGPLLRRLQPAIPDMLNDFVVVTLTRPGPLYVRLRPDARGLVVVNNFESVPDDLHTGCPRLGPIESVGMVMPGDALASVNRDVLYGRVFSESVRMIRDASSRATVAEPCLLCFRRADPACMEANKEAPPRSLEQEKRKSLERLLAGGEEGLLDQVKLRGITSTGVPDAGGLRPVLWRLLLRCLPANRLEWPEQLQAQRALYARFVQDLITKPAEAVTASGHTRARSCQNPRNGIWKETDTVNGKPTANGGCGEVERTAQTVLHRWNSELTGAKRTEATTDAELAQRSSLAALAGGASANALQSVENGATRSHSRARESFIDRDIGTECLGRTAVEAQADAPLIVEDAAIPSVAATRLPLSLPAAANEHFRRGSRGNGELRPVDDDPLSNKDSSGWAALWSDKDLMQTIEQDVVRTMPDLAFYACRGIGDSDSDNDADGDDTNCHGRSEGGGIDDTGKQARGERHRRGRERRHAISRILFVHAKLNPAESYTQGMNEIVATLFFVLATDDAEEWRQHCEADTFFCFTNLMAEIRDVFIQSLDESESGLQGKMEAFWRTLRHHDPELAGHMASLALDPRYFALRWFTTLLSREFDLPDTIRLWDSLFAAQDRTTFLVFLSVTLLLAQREALLAGDFASNLQLLQAYPPTDVPEILAQSEALQLFSARGDAASVVGSREQRAREAAESARAAAEQVNVVARKLWNAAADLAAGAAVRMSNINEGSDDHQGSL